MQRPCPGTPSFTRPGITNSVWIRQRGHLKPNQERAPGKKPVVAKKGKKAVDVKKQKKPLVGKKAVATKKPATEKKPPEKKYITEEKKPAAKLKFVYSIKKTWSSLRSSGRDMLEKAAEDNSLSGSTPHLSKAHQLDVLLLLRLGQDTLTMDRTEGSPGLALPTLQTSSIFLAPGPNSNDLNGLGRPDIQQDDQKYKVVYGNQEKRALLEETKYIRVLPSQGEEEEDESKWLVQTNWMGLSAHKPTHRQFITIGNRS
ncbi:hypothetical protein MC885_012800, partial [Smutsia gigantea]